MPDGLPDALLDPMLAGAFIANDQIQTPAAVSVSRHGRARCFYSERKPSTEDSGISLLLR